MSRVVLVTALKWLVNLTAVVLVVIALLPVSLTAAVLMAILFNLAAIIPLQTVGGIGVGEAVFAGGMSFFGVDLATGAGVALVLRALLITAPLIFLLLALTVGHALQPTVNRETTQA